MFASRSLHPTAPRPRLGAKALALLGLVALGTGLAAAPASADEFPPKPTASATLACDGADLVNGAVLTVELGNVAGLDTAHFVVAYTDVAGTSYDVTQGTSTSEVFYDFLGENSDVTVTVTADDGFSYEQSFHVDCTDFVGGVVLTCDGTQAVLTYEATAIGQLGDEVFFALDGDDLGEHHLEPGESTSFTVDVPDDIAFEAELLADADGTISDLVGTPHCAAPVTTTSTTTTSTTVAPTVPTTGPTQVLPQEITPAPPVAPTELPRTGSSTLPLTLLGTTLVLCGALVRRQALRRA